VVLEFAGISEEELGEEIGDLLGTSDPALAPLVGPGEVGRGQVNIRLTTRAPTREVANEKIRPLADELLRRLSEYYLGKKQA
jgi:molybdopterin-biosynthesis enzyme MoeA-like protein